MDKLYLDQQCQSIFNSTPNLPKIKFQRSMQNFNRKLEKHKKTIERIDTQDLTSIIKK